MSFEAKRLRVQLPCDPGGTVIEEGAQQAAGLCPMPSFCICTNVTACRQFCTQLSPCLCSHLTPCHFGTWGCQHFVTCIVVNSGICQHGSACGPLASLCEIRARAVPLESVRAAACSPARIRARSSSTRSISRRSGRRSRRSSRRSRRPSRRSRSAKAASSRRDQERRRPRRPRHGRLRCLSAPRD